MAEMVAQNSLTARKRLQDLIVNKQRKSPNKDAKYLKQVDKYVPTQVAELIDEKKVELAKNLQAKRRFQELQRQVDHKRRMEENQRLYLDEKQLAINGQLMSKINPELIKNRHDPSQQ